MIQAVVLDLDGLIVDSEPLHQRAFSILLARHGILHEFSEEEYGREFVGMPVRENAAYLIERFGLRGTVDEILAEREAIYEALIADPANLAPMPGALAFLDALRARALALAVATGSPRRQGELILRGLGIAECFRVLVTGSDVPRSKPAPDVYLRAARELGLAPARCVAIEDSATGVASAKAAGMRVIVVPNRYTAHQDLRADARAENLEQALAMLDTRL